MEVAEACLVGEFILCIFVEKFFFQFTCIVPISCSALLITARAFRVVSVFLMRVLALYCHGRKVADRKSVLFSSLGVMCGWYCCSSVDLSLFLGKRRIEIQLPNTTYYIDM